MTTATLVPEERVLIPDGRTIKKLRESRDWTLEEAIHQARERRLPLTGSTLRNAERGNAGCRLSTIGWIMKLYDVDDFHKIVVHVADPPVGRPEPASKRRPTRRA